jgi:hypothetical protein
VQFEFVAVVVNIIVIFFHQGLLDETPKVTQLEDDRFSRMEHFYGADDIEPDMLQDLELGNDGKVRSSFSHRR